MTQITKKLTAFDVYTKGCAGRKTSVLKPMYVRIVPIESMVTSKAMVQTVKLAAMRE